MKKIILKTALGIGFLFPLLQAQVSFAAQEAESTQRSERVAVLRELVKLNATIGAYNGINEFFTEIIPTLDKNNPDTTEAVKTLETKLAENKEKLTAKQVVSDELIKNKVELFGSNEDRANIQKLTSSLRTAYQIQTYVSSYQELSIDIVELKPLLEQDFVTAVKKYNDVLAYFKTTQEELFPK